VVHTFSFQNNNQYIEFQVGQNKENPKGNL
jgi:hypothetical protein